MLTEKTIQLVKATAPLVAQHAEEITRRFYTLMFEGNPEVKAYFNAAHQHSGGQQRALAGAICAYAANIDNLAALGPAVELIAQKHCSLGIKPEHYPIVGKYLLVAVKDVLGDPVTDEIVAAWAEAYGFLADIFINREGAIYREQAEQPGGWNGYRPFRIDRKVPESETITSFYLKPVDGGPLPPFKPGQYITVKIDDTATPTSPRNYSLSDRPGRDYFRITVKREPGAPPGVISNHLHDRANAGDVIQVGPPCGEFTLDANLPAGRPVVLLSGSVGLTPLLSMLHTLANENDGRPVWFVHAALHGGTHALAHEVRALAAASPNIRTHFRYSRPLDADHEPRRYDSTGYLDAALLKELNVPADAEYYLCGPRPFMSAVFQQLNLHGVPLDKIHYEFFGPRQEVIAPAPPQAVGAA